MSFRPHKMSTPLSRSDSVASFSSQKQQQQQPPSKPNSRKHESPRKESSPRKAVAAKHLRNSTSKGKQNNSNQRGAEQQESSSPSTPTKRGRVRVLNRGEPLDSAEPVAPGKRQQGRPKRHQPSPPRYDDAVAGEPRTPPRQQRPVSAVLSPAPRMGQPAVFGTPPRVRSPPKSNHYAGASFNNSPAPSSLPLPPFLTSPTKGGFGQVNMALDERSRQLENMLGGLAQPANRSSVDLTQPATDVASMFQKLRLIKEMHPRPATVAPINNQIQQLAPVYNA
ncbi:hypothetical protein GGI25_004111 [Coemansia spiralis]|uniref:Uncharacterized protein n=2 Tax=Coemansia TaxID=4863 RepID=A0A9W8KVV9_9FUNG|nr:hypothetical protein EDC05_003943 [Coemansia umbellata]KAJ2622395.1 hypothetical protein GGI26_003258 [Coemansia sp. RSA 1358]KAJ2675062.1 hypothetical protein GGI25_004111 [Coemansia spiralis]